MWIILLSIRFGLSKIIQQQPSHTQKEFFLDLFFILFILFLNFITINNKIKNMSRRGRGITFRPEDVERLLNLAERILPTGPNEWNLWIIFRLYFRL